MHSTDPTPTNGLWSFSSLGVWRQIAVGVGAAVCEGVPQKLHVPFLSCQLSLIPICHPSVRPSLCLLFLNDLLWVGWMGWGRGDWERDIEDNNHFLKKYTCT